MCLHKERKLLHSYALKTKIEDRNRERKRKKERRKTWKGSGVKSKLLFLNFSSSTSFLWMLLELRMVISIISLPQSHLGKTTNERVGSLGEGKSKKL